MEYSPYQCGFTNVWKGQYHGQGVVAKVFEFSPASNLEKARKASYPRLVVYINKLTASHTEVLPGGYGMEGPPPSERGATIRHYDDQDPAGDGIRVDGQWDHKRVCEREPRRRSVETRVFFVQGPHLTIDTVTVAEGGYWGADLHA